MGTAGGNARLVEALADGLHIEYNSIVDRVQYAGSGVKVHAGGRVYDGVLLLGWHVWSRTPRHHHTSLLAC